MIEDIMPKEPIVEPTYLGDGVYATFDGYQIWLGINDHDSPPVVAIEPAVYEALQQYAKRVWAIEK